MSQIEDFRMAVSHIRRSPSILAGGVLVVVSWVAIWVGGGHVLRLVLPELRQLALEGQATTPVYGIPSYTSPSVILIEITILVGFFFVMLDLAWVVVALPSTSTISTIVRGKETDLGPALRSTARDLPRLLPTAVLHRTQVWLCFPLAMATALAIYLSLGTMLEGLWYTLAAYRLTPWWYPLAILGLIAFAGRRIATTALGRPDLAVTVYRDRPVRDIVRETGVRSLATPRRTFTDGTVETGLFAIPVLTVVMLGTMVTPSLGMDALDLLAVGVSGILGIVGLTLAMVYRTLRSDRRRDESINTRLGDEPPTWSTLGRSIPTLKVTLVLTLVVLGAIGVATVRYTDTNPVTRTVEPPGTVSGSDDPTRILGDGTAAVRSTNHTERYSFRYRRVYDNGTSDEWSVQNVVLAVDAPNEQYRINGPLGESMRIVTYFEQTMIAQTGYYVENSSPTDTSQWARNTVVVPRIPGMPATPSRTDQVEEFTHIPSPGHTGDQWQVITTSENRVVLRSEDTETVARFGVSGVSTADIDNASVRVVIDTQTGYIRQIIWRYVIRQENEPYNVQRRYTIGIDKYGTTDLERPPGIEPGFLVDFLDILVY